MVQCDVFSCCSNVSPGQQGEMAQSQLTDFEARKYATDDLSS